MSKTGRPNHRRASREAKRRSSAGVDRRITVHSEKRPAPDLYKLSRAVITIALADAEAEKTATRDADTDTSNTADEKTGEEDRHDEK